MSDYHLRHYFDLKSLNDWEGKHAFLFSLSSHEFPRMRRKENPLDQAARPAGWLPLAGLRYRSTVKDTMDAAHCRTRIEKNMHASWL